MHQSQQLSVSPPLYSLDLSSPETDTPNKQHRLKNPPEELEPDCIISDDSDNNIFFPENFQGSPSLLGEGGIAESMGGEEGITRVDSNIEAVVQGSH